MNLKHLSILILIKILYGYIILQFKNLLFIGKFEPSSKTCSKCGKINRELKLSDRNWLCSCGINHDRDINAAINIKHFGLRNKINKV